MDIIEIAEQEIETFDRPAAQTSLLLIDEIKTLRSKLAAMESQEPALRINSMGGAMQWNPNYKGDWSGVFYAKPMPADKPSAAVPDAGVAFDIFVAGIGGLDSDAWHDYPVDEVFHKGFGAGLAAAPSHSQQCAKGETELRAMVENCREYCFRHDILSSAFLKWLDVEGCNLAAELNADRCPSHESEKGAEK